MNENLKPILIIGAVLIVLGIMFTFVVSSQSANGVVKDIGKFYLGEDIYLWQTCDCSYVNFTSIVKEGSDVNILSIPIQAQKRGTYFNHTLNGSLITSVGQYIVTGEGSINGTVETFPYTFQVAQGGLLRFDLNTPIGITLLVILFIIVLVLALYKQLFFSGVLMVVIGVFLFHNDVQLVVCITLAIIGTVMAGIGLRGMQ